MNWNKLTIRLLATIFFAMLVGAAASHVLWQLPPLKGFGSSVFLFVAGALVLAGGQNKDRFRLLIIGLLGFASEVIGVKYGWLFGAYHYTDVLAPNLLKVPVAMCCAWLILIAYLKQLLARFSLSMWFEAGLIGLWMTVIDLLIDPLASQPFNYWVWLEQGSYYGIPARNFAGWFIVSAIIILLDRKLVGAFWLENKWAEFVGISVIALYLICAIAYGYQMVIVIGIALCLIHVLLLVSKGNLLSLGQTSGKVKN